MGNLERLRKLYFNPKEQGSFGGVERLSNASGLHRRDVQKWLSQQDVYTLHKPVRYKFQRRKTIAYGVNELWQSDLLDMQIYLVTTKVIVIY
ncbi:chromo domain-containing protein [Trichonephila clavipes]|nr:chromo domain-containing protein [Trichonephila clavipes]